MPTQTSRFLPVLLLFCAETKAHSMQAGLNLVPFFLPLSLDGRGEAPTSGSFRSLLMALSPPFPLYILRAHFRSEALDREASPGLATSSL